MSRQGHVASPEDVSALQSFNEVVRHDTSSFVVDRQQMLRNVFEEIAEDLHILSALGVVNKSELDAEDSYHKLLALVHADVARALVALGTSSAASMPATQSACPCVAEQREQARRELLALDVFSNSTAHEEYRPS